MLTEEQIRLFKTEAALDGSVSAFYSDRIRDGDLSLEEASELAGIHFVIQASFYGRVPRDKRCVWSKNEVDIWSWQVAESPQ
jgi:hypothetical protein